MSTLTHLASLAPPLPARPIQSTAPTSVTERVRKYLENTPPPVTGSGSNQDMFRACCVAGNDFNLSDDQALPLLTEWARRGDPTWTEDQIAKLQAKARKAAKKPAGCKADAQFDKPVQRQRSAPDESLSSGNAEDLESPQSDSPQPDLSGPLPVTDMDNAERLVIAAALELKFVREWKWLGYNGEFWEIDSGLAQELYKKYVPPKILQEVSERMKMKTGQGKHDAFVDSQVKKLRKWGQDSKMYNRMQNCLAMASTDRRIVAQTDMFDCADWLFNVANGTIDLKTGKLMEHSKGDLFTKISPVLYDPEAKAPLWHAFLERVFLDDQDLIDYVQKAIGYTMTGTSTEQCCFICHGSGCNGKSVFTETLSKLFGTFSAETPIETLMEARKEGAISNDVARLRGIRLLTSNEGKDGQKLDESKLKTLTGSDRISARFLHKEFFEFVPRFTLWLRTNKMPIIQGVDLGIWRRLRKIPFLAIITDAEKDPNLMHKLEAELPGILNWAVEGCLKWQKEGLQLPDAVRIATEDYQDQQDTIGMFLRDRCVIEPTGEVSSSALRKAYDDWCDKQGEKFGLSPKRFGAAIQEKGFRYDKNLGPHRTLRGYHGLRLKSIVELHKTEEEEAALSESYSQPHLRLVTPMNGGQEI